VRRWTLVETQSMMALHGSRYVRDTLEHNPDTMFQLRLDEVQVFNRMGVESKRRLSFPSRLADIRESAWQQEQARMRQGRDRDDGWRRIQVCIEGSGSDDEDAGGGTRGNDRERLPSNQIPERGRSYKSHQIKRPSAGGYQEHGIRSDSSYHQRMTSGSSAYREHGMSKPPALFSYHNVQKKSCLVEESEEDSETGDEEEERENLHEEEKEELFDSEESEENEGDEEEKVVEEVRWWGGSGGSGGSGLRKMSPSSSVKSLQAEARRRFSVGDPCFQFPSQPYVESPATLYIQPEDRLNYILEEEETEDEEEEERGISEEEEEERITFSIEEEDEDEEECERFPVNECDEDTPSYTVEEEEEEQEERLIPIMIEEEETSWKNFSPSYSKDSAEESKPTHDSLTRDERAAAISEIVRSQQRDVGVRLRRNTREESVSAIGDLIKDLSAELEQLKQNRRVLESLRRHSTTTEAPPVMSKPPKGQNSGSTGGSRLPMMGEQRRRNKPPRAEFTTYADLLETMCTSRPNAATQRQRSPTSRRHSSVVLPTSSSLLLRENSKPSRPKRFSTSGSGSLLSSSACPVVKEEEPACETYSCDQLVIKAKSLSCNSLDSASSHSPPSSTSSSLSSSDSMADLGSEQSSESELMSDPSSCDELWLLPQQVLAMDVDLLQAELPLSRSSSEDLRPEDLRFARASPSKSTFWMYSVVQGRLRSC